MALFDLDCKNCGHQFEGNIKITEERYSEACPGCGILGCMDKVFLKTAKIVSGVNLRAKVPQGFKDVMSKIKKNNPHGNFDGDIAP